MDRTTNKRTMEATTESDQVIKTLHPPTQKKLVIKDKLSLVLEIIWLNFLILPSILWAMFRTIFPPREKSLKDQVVVVTGAGRGLGRGLALRLGKEGCRVAVADVNKANAIETAEEIVRAGGVAKPYFTNVAVVEEVKNLRIAVTQDLGPVDMLINNAGLIHGTPLDKSLDEEIRAIIDVNLVSHFWMVREFLPDMKERNKGHIVAIASLSAYCPLGNASQYVAAKFGIRGFMESLRMELAEVQNNQVKTTTVCPYFINTSADYVDHWDIRFPPISIEEAVEATITGIKREEVSFVVPNSLSFVPALFSLLPQYLKDKGQDIVYCRIIPPTEEEKIGHPTAAIIRDLAKNHGN